MTTKYIIIGLLVILLFIIGYFSIQSNKENYNIYHDFKKSLNPINQLVRKNNWTYYEANTNTKNWILSLINTKNCKNLFISDNIYYGHPDLEFNYSHTMGNNIILSNRDYKKLQRYYTNKDESSIYNMGSLIVHESVHIDQRYNYDKYKSLYKLWGYEFGDIQNIDVLLETKRQNPDANDNDIVWSDGTNYYFINCFYDKNKPNEDVNTYAYQISKKGNTFIYEGSQGILLNDLRSYNDFFGNIHSNYTPNEICAEYTEIVFSTCLYGSTNFDKPAYIIFKNYFNY
jgi:hypothetical protein